MRGCLITLEGIDGTGKSTVAKALEDRLEGSRLGESHRGVSYRDKGYRGGDRRFVFTAEPTGGEIGQILRRRHLAQSAPEWSEDSKRSKDRGPGPETFEELFLFMADHAEHLSRVVNPALERGDVVVSDRYSDSRIAYQGVTLREAVPDAVDWVRGLHHPWSVRPDLTLLFEIDPALAVERCHSRSKDHHETETGKAREKFEQEDFLRQVQGVFELLRRQEPERFVIIDALPGADAVVEKALNIILSFLEARGRTPRRIP